MALAAVVKSNKKFCSAKISKSIEDSLLSLEGNEGNTAVFNPNEAREGVIKRTFHLGGSKYVIFHGSQGLIANIYWKEWEDGEVKNKGIKLAVPKLVVILHYVEFIMSSIKNFRW